MASGLGSQKSISRGELNGPAVWSHCRGGKEVSQLRIVNGRPHCIVPVVGGENEYTAGGVQGDDDVLGVIKVFLINLGVQRLGASQLELSFVVASTIRVRVNV